MRKMVYRGFSMALGFAVFLVLLVLISGATGSSDKILGAMVNEELRTLRQSLAQGIRDPEELERVLVVREQELRSFYGIDKPWYSRLPQNVIRLLKLDLGDARTERSFSGSRKIRDIGLERLVNTALFMTTSFVITVVIALPLGVWLATRAGTRIDRTVSMASVSSFALPAWWVGVILIYVFAVKIGVLPSGGMYSTPPPIGGLGRLLDLLKHAILPTASLVLVSIGYYIYLIRAITVKIAQEPFVMFARARGLSEWTVRLRYILRVAAPPIATNLALGLVGTFGGAIITEAVFNWPGMGRLTYDAILGTPDDGIFLAVTFLGAALFTLTRFFLEVVKIRLDPRLRD